MKQRVISAIVMLMIFIPVLILGSWPFYLLVFILGMIAVQELLKLNSKLPMFLKIITYLFSAFLILYDVIGWKNTMNFDYRILIILLFVYLALLVFINNQEKYNYRDAFFLIGITLFIGISFHNFISIRNTGIFLMIYLFLITTVTDSFAFFVGKAFGKHKLAPLISPNKTVEGFVGGSVVGTIVASVFYLLVVKGCSNVSFVVLVTFLLTMVGQLGDLIKSSIKRHEGIKDFSNLIPGHGGVLDRLDSIIFVIMAYILISGLF